MTVIRNRLILQTKTTTDGPHGPVTTWEDSDAIFALVEPLSVDARAKYSQVAGESSYRVILQGKWSLSLADSRFKWPAGEVILAPIEPPMDPDGRGRQTVIVVKVDPNA